MSTMSSHGRRDRGDKQLSESSLLRALIPFMSLETHDLITSLKAPSLRTATVGVKFQQEFWRGHLHPKADGLSSTRPLSVDAAGFR